MSRKNLRRIQPGKRDMLWKKVRSEQRKCHLCGYPIDYSIRHPDRRSFELDEIVPVSKGGDPLDYGNVDAAHRCCNQWRGNKTLTHGVRRMCRRRYEREVLHKSPTARRERKPSVTYQTSRKWLPGG